MTTDTADGAETEARAGAVIAAGAVSAHSSIGAQQSKGPIARSDGPPGGQQRLGAAEAPPATKRTARKAAWSFIT
jgi:hypothetical protein